MIIFASPIIELLFTKTYLSGAPYLRLYAFWYLTLLIPQDSVARALGQAKWILGNFISFALITLTLCFLGSYFYGTIGVLCGLLVSRFTSRLYTVYYMKKTLNWKVRDFVPFGNMTKITLICLALGLGCLYLKPLFNSPLKWFLICGSAFTLSYFALARSMFFEKKNKSTKVLMLTPGLFIGGLERMILNLSKSLKLTSDWKPQVLAYDFSPSGGSHLVSSFEGLDIPVHFQLKPPRFSFRTATKIASMISRDDVRVIHTHDLGALIYGVVAKLLVFAQVKLVHTQHSFVYVHQSRKYRYYERFFSHFANSIAVVSEDTARSCLELGISQSKLHLIPNGVDFPQVPDTDRGARMKARSELLPEAMAAREDYWILYLARIHGGKGQDHALKLWNSLSADTRHKCRLIFVGPATDTHEAERIGGLISKSMDPEHICMAGPSLKPHDWLRCADLYLSCSEFEGMPLSPVEAIGSGIPSVLSDIPGHDFLKSYAETYSLSDPNAGALHLEKIVALMVENDSKLRESAWISSQGLRDAFTLKSMSTRYEKLYEANA